jgi:purine-binding chemotaxis protein CheW
MEQSTSFQRKDGAELFGSFHLGDAELVLPVAAVQEVVNYPEAVTQLPLSPSHLLGLFNLRGRLVPIVHLGQLLQVPTQGELRAAKIAIVELAKGCVGLLFDNTGEILRVHGEEKVMFAGHSSSLIGGVLKLDGGHRILQLLSVEALGNLADMPILKLDAHAADTSRLRAVRGQRRQSVSFRVGGSRLGLPMGAIHEIIRVPELLRSVLASELCLGMLNLRGDTLPVLDFARFLGLSPSSTGGFSPGDFDDPRRILVIKQGDICIGLLVDDVESIVGYHEEELLAIPSFQAQRAELFASCISKADGKQILLLDDAALVADPTLLDVTDGHRELYRTEDNAHGVQGKRRSGPRETYVTFRLDQLMGMRIEQLREVIDYPADVMQPPGAPPFVRGILNLRRRLVTIVDLRVLYGMAGYHDLAGAKVLVVENGEEKFGLVVDAIENIVTIDANDKLRVPSVLGNQIDHALRSDMKEVVELPDHRTLMLLDAEPLKARLAGERVH